jgi:hypothetical protein
VSNSKWCCLSRCFHKTYKLIIADSTQWAAEFELINASNRFLEQFSRNPFAGTKMKEHVPRSVAGKATPQGRPASVAGDPFADLVAAGRETFATANVGGITSPGGAQGADAVTTPVTSENGTSAGDSPVKIITKKPTFKLSKFHHPNHFSHYQTCK